MKILIWDDFQIVNSGGPSGYLYNIREYLKNHSSNHIVFLSDIKESIRVINKGEPVSIVDSSSNNDDDNKTFIQKTYSILNDSDNLIIKKTLYIYHAIKRKLLTIKKNIKTPIESIQYFTKKQFAEPHYERLDIKSLNEFDYIHFHIVVQFTRFKASYPECKSKTILTSHSPCPYIKELICSEKKWMRLFQPLALKSESIAYRTCDYMMFPCREAMEPYNKVGIIRRALNSKKEKIFYVTTSILDFQSKIDGCELRSKNGIPNNHFVITYFGRHSRIKGYDILKKVGIDFLNKHKECTIVCAGKGDIEMPKHNRWIELGFIDNVNDYLSISDIHVIPNRDTYFDIAMLEVLRAGKQVIISRTGGNKYFLKYPEEERSAIHYFNTNKYNELYNLLEEALLKKLKNDVIYRNNGYKNRTLFLNHFSLNDYYNNYIKQIESLKTSTVN